MSMEAERSIGFSTSASTVPSDDENIHVLASSDDVHCHPGQPEVPESTGSTHERANSEPSPADAHAAGDSTSLLPLDAEFVVSLSAEFDKLFEDSDHREEEFAEERLKEQFVTTRQGLTPGSSGTASSISSADACPSACDPFGSSREAFSQDRIPTSIQVSLKVTRMDKGAASPRPHSSRWGLSAKNQRQIAESVYGQRPDSVVKQPRFKPVHCLPVRTLPHVPGAGMQLLINSGAVTSRPGGTMPKRHTESADMGIERICSEEVVEVARRLSVGGRPASAPSTPSPLAAQRMRPKSCRFENRFTASRIGSATWKSRPDLPSAVSSSSVSNQLHYEGNPYEIVPLAMADKRNQSIPSSRWPYGSTWISRESRYDGYCTPKLPADSRTPSRCGMESLEQLYGRSLKLDVAHVRSSVTSTSHLAEKGNEDDLLSIHAKMAQADDIDRRVFESELRGRQLLSMVQEERFELAQVNAVEELARDNGVLWRSLGCRDGGGYFAIRDKMLYCAERNSREGAEAKRRVAFQTKELLAARYQRVLESWSRIVFHKTNHLAMRIREAATSIRDKISASATAMQAIGRGFLGRKRVKHLRQLAFQRTLFVAVRLQSLYRGWKSRLRVKVLRKLKTTSKAAQRLFQAQRAFASFDQDGDGMISPAEFKNTLADMGAHLDDAAIDKILDSLSSKSNYRSAVAKAEKAREKKYQLFLQGEIDKYDEEEPFAPIRGQSLPLTFSDFCALIDLDVSQNAILKMQEAIKIFATFDADGSGAIDGEEVQEAVAAMETFTGVAVDELAVQEALQMGEGEIDFETFVNIFGVDTGSSDTAFDDRVEVAFRAFQQIDSEGNGSVGPADLNRGLQLMGIEVGIDEMQRMFDEVDDDCSGMIDFLEFCQVSGIHNISERLKRKYMPAYEEEVSDDEDPEARTHRVLMTNAYEDNEALVGHPGSRCQPVVNLRVTPSKAFRSGTFHGVGSITHVVGGMRVLVEHDDGTTRYYDCGNGERFELVVVPKVLLKEGQLDVYYKAQPHLTENVAKQKEQNRKRTTRRQFDHLDRSQFLLEILSHGKDGPAREKIFAEKEVLDAAIRKRMKNEVQEHWGKLRSRRASLSVNSPSRSISSRRMSISCKPDAATHRQGSTSLQGRNSFKAVKETGESPPVGLMASVAEGPSFPSARVSIARTAALSKSVELGERFPAPPACSGAQEDAAAPVGHAAGLDSRLLPTASAARLDSMYSWDNKMKAREQLLRERSMKMKPGAQMVRGSTRKLLEPEALTPKQPSSPDDRTRNMNWKRSTSFRGSMSSFKGLPKPVDNAGGDSPGAGVETVQPLQNFSALKANWRQAQSFKGSQDSFHHRSPSSADGQGGISATSGQDKQNKLFGMGASFKIRSNFRTKFAVSSSGSGCG